MKGERQIKKGVEALTSSSYTVESEEKLFIINGTRNGVIKVINRGTKE
jgi:hypothetical protein